MGALKYTVIPMKYTDHDGEPRQVKGCTFSVDQLDRHYIWCEQEQRNLVYRTKGRENALLAAISDLLFAIQLQDERLRALQRIADLAEEFAEAVNPCPCDQSC